MAARRLHRLRMDRRSDDRGLTMVELMMVMFILAIIFPLVAGLLFTAQRQSAAASTRTAAQAQAQIMDEYLSRLINSTNYPNGGAAGSDILIANATEFEFYSSQGAASGASATFPTLIDLKLVTACSGCSYYTLEAIETPPSGTTPTYPSSGAVTTILGSGIVVPTSVAAGCPTTGSSIPVFEYDEASTCIQTAANTSSSAGPPANLIMANTGTPAQFGLIDTVTVTMTVIDTLHAKSSAQPVFTYTFSMPNVDYNHAGF